MAHFLLVLALDVIMDLLPNYICFFCIPMAATVPIAVLICRYRVARRRRISYGTMLAAAACIPLFLAVIATCLQPDIWWTREDKNVPDVWPVMLFFMAAMCLLPSLFVVVYYQRRSRSDETRVA